MFLFPTVVGDFSLIQLIETDSAAHLASYSMSSGRHFLMG